MSHDAEEWQHSASRRRKPRLPTKPAGAPGHRVPAGESTVQGAGLDRRHAATYAGGSGAPDQVGMRNTRRSSPSSRPTRVRKRNGNRTRATPATRPSPPAAASAHYGQAAARSVGRGCTRAASMGRWTAELRARTATAPPSECDGARQLRNVSRSDWASACAGGSGGESRLQTRLRRVGLRHVLHRRGASKTTPRCSLSVWDVRRSARSSNTFSASSRASPRRGSLVGRHLRRPWDPREGGVRPGSRPSAVPPVKRGSLARAHATALTRQAIPDLAGLSDRALDHL